MGKTILVLRKFFGFTRTRSLIGKHAQQTLTRHRTRRVISILIVALLTSTFMIHNFANMGGPFVLNFSHETAPRVLIDARTGQSAQLPIAYEYESRGYSWIHSGADLVAPVGTPVRAIMSGVVEAAPYDAAGYGKHVIVFHGAGLRSIYGHLSLIEVTVGQQVTQETELGKSGSTGFSTGPHLHLEIRENNTPINPAEIVPEIN